MFFVGTVFGPDENKKQNKKTPQVRLHLEKSQADINCCGIYFGLEEDFNTVRYAKVKTTTTST